MYECAAACMYLCVRQQRSFKKPHTEIKVAGRLILFFLFLKGNVGLKIKPGPTNLEASTEHMACVYNGSVCACLISLSLVPVGIHMHLWARGSVFLPARICASLFVCPNVCVRVCLTLCKCPYANVFCWCEWAEAGSLAGHICDHRLLLTLKL